MIGFNGHYVSEPYSTGQTRWSAFQNLTRAKNGQTEKEDGAESYDDYKKRRYRTLLLSKKAGGSYTLSQEDNDTIKDIENRWKKGDYITDLERQLLDNFSKYYT